jgi:NADPH:quinone reductase-like Zn-dependent oxidoreductase
MKAMIYTQYGAADVIHAAEVPPPAPKDNEVLIKIHAASINSADYRLMHGQPFMVRFVYGLFKPRHTILGSDIAGRVEAVGKAVTQFKVGDEVYGDLSNAGLGGFAEYACAPENVIVRKPQNLSFEEAAAVPMAAITALQALRDKGQVCAGQRVAINGASGGVGTFAVQIAKTLGAHVTAICSTRNLEAVRALGADQVIDYTQTDFTASGQHYDVIVGVNGYHPLEQACAQPDGEAQRGGFAVHEYAARKRQGAPRHRALLPTGRTRRRHALCRKWTRARQGGSRAGVRGD